jgi:hypothetical protein
MNANVEDSSVPGAVFFVTNVNCEAALELGVPRLGATSVRNPVFPVPWTLFVIYRISNFATSPGKCIYINPGLQSWGRHCQGRL